MGLAESSYSPSPRTRVLIVNPHATEREGLAALLARHDTVELVGVTGTAEDAAEAMAAAAPEVLVVDLATAQEGGIDTLRRLLQHPAHPRVVAIRRDYSRDQVAAAFEAGVSACVSTNAGVSDLLTAVQAAQAGRTFLCPFVTRVLIEQPSAPPVTVPPGGRQLTRRELEVLELIAGGHTDRQIAGQIQLAVGTVHTHRKHIMAKLGVRNVTSLLRRARELGVLPPG